MSQAGAFGGVHGLDEGDGAEFYERAKEIVQEMMKTSTQRINVRKETKEEYEREMEVRQARHSEQVASEEGEGGAGRAQ